MLRYEMQQFPPPLLRDCMDVRRGELPRARTYERARGRASALGRG
jgi:hypothetical protein